MPTKIGRNDPCWCGSGKKYKKCHLDREFAKRVPFTAVSDALRATQRQCLHPLAATGVCDRIISAHTIQRSRVLKQIIDSTGHVRTFFPPELDRSSGRPRLQLHRVGWRQASTFTGFCAKYDTSVFKPLETADFIGTPEQCFLIGYRALCHEIYIKSGLLRSHQTVRQLVDRGVSVEAQRKIQTMWDHMETGTRRGIAAMQELKAGMDQHLLKYDYSGWCRAVVSFRGDLCVASTSTISPNRDVDGQQLQVLHDLNAHVQELMFGLVAASDGGAAVFAWREGESAPQRFVESLLNKEKRLLPSLITQFMFAYIENTYFATRWWESLSMANREHLEALANVRPI